jgi:acetylornithine deacetylase/succinyl-diaminopimelate desuccinylase-like protein
MADPFAKIDQYVISSREQFEADLARMVAVPTVSASPKHHPDILRGARLAVRLLKDAGFEARVTPTQGNPVVIGSLIVEDSYPTVTLYNHLDVQPADASEWQTDPFHLEIQGDRYIGRGATDDKGPALTVLAAIRYAVSRKIPLNFKVIWEFEEEIGSTHFAEFVAAHMEELATDSVVVSDTIWTAAGKPAIPMGLRGLVTFEVSLRTGQKDTHSGLAGGAARNPLGELAQMISECYDAQSGHVLIPGFYDGVTPATEAELKAYMGSGFSVAQFIIDHELKSLRTHEPKSVLSRIMAEPTFEVHGIVGGYIGPGVKTVVPPAATVKLSARLVPGQNPHHIFRLISNFITSRHPDMEVSLEASAAAYLADTHGGYADAARIATQFAFGVQPTFVREGGSIGAVLTMHEQMHVPVMLLGLSLPEHGYHAPDEYFDWGQAAGGIKLFAKYFAGIAAL